MVMLDRAINFGDFFGGSKKALLRGTGVFDHFWIGPYYTGTHFLKQEGIPVSVKGKSNFRKGR
jgi:hypothetical protein